MPKKQVKLRSSRKPSPRPKRAPRGNRQKEEAAFVNSLIAHSQAVVVGPGDKLPPGATHELVKDDRGTLKAVRKRFSAL